jgi:hypothetical protein
LHGDALRLWRGAGDRWKDAARGKAVNASLHGALVKADIQCARIALVLAESASPLAGGRIPADAVSGAIAIIDYVMGCWRALPSRESFIVTRRDAVLKPKVPQLLGWLEQHGGKATKRQLQQAGVCGITSAREAEMLLAEYQIAYPGTVRSERTGKRGPETVFVYAPERA